MSGVLPPLSLHPFMACFIFPLQNILTEFDETWEGGYTNIYHIKIMVIRIDSLLYIKLMPNYGEFLKNSSPNRNVLTTFI